MKNLAVLLSLFLVTLPVTSYAVTFSPTMDSYVRSDNPNTNYGASTWMQSGSTPEPPYYYLYTQFDLSSIPSSATINSAILYFYIWDATVGIPTSQIYIHPNMGVWNEATITWTSKPPAGANCGTCLNSPTPGQWMQIDVKDGVQKWVSGTLTNYGLRVHAWGGGYLKTYSRENSSFQPYLVVTYSGGSQPPGPFNLISPANGATLPAGYITFVWQASSGANSYTLYLDSSNYPGLTSTQHTLSVTTLGSHNWHVVAFKGSGQTTSNPPNSIFYIIEPGTKVATPSLGVIKAFFKPALLIGKKGVLNRYRYMEEVISP